MKSCPDCAATYPEDYAICPRDGAPLHETTLWQIGTVIRGKYRIKARLGEGGMAVVYKAHHELLDEFRALKVIKPDLARDTEFMSRFKNEAIMARKLNHPNAVRVDDLEVAEDGLPFIAMELVVGDTLETLVQRAGPLPVSLVLDIAANICDALHAAHKLGLIHRDVKPDNIVLIAQREGPPVAKILDFGISRLRESVPGSKGLTQTGMIIGTPEYMSPEQATAKRGFEIDGRSDLYSLGLVMHRMLTGEMPFQAESTVEIFLEHLKTEPHAPHHLKPELAIPEAVSSIVMKALEKDREKRFATAAEMSAAIKKARGSTTHPLRKIDWESLSNATASFGADSDAPSSPAKRSPPPMPPPATPPPVISTIPASGGSMYRSSARITPPPHREYGRRLLSALLALAVAVLIVSGFAAWEVRKYAKQHARTSSAPGNSLPSSEKRAVGSSPMGPSSSSSQSSTRREKLTDEEQAKIKEQISLADVYYRQGGCDKALPIYQQVLALDPGNPRAYAAVDRCYSQARNGASTTPAPSAAPNSSPNP
jgi:serine/threonine protein kinase